MKPRLLTRYMKTLLGRGLYKGVEPSAKQHKLVQQLLAGASPGEVQTTAELMERTIQRYVKDPLHGTTVEAAKDILGGKFKGGTVFFGDTPLAEHYARKRVRERGGAEALIGIKPVSSLSPDQQKSYVKSFTRLQIKSNYAAWDAVDEGFQFSIFPGFSKGAPGELFQIKGIRPSSGSPASWITKKDVIKSHYPDFPAARTQPFKTGTTRRIYFDLETQGLQRFQKELGRGRGDPLLISQFSVFDPTGRHEMSGRFTNILEHLTGVDPENIPDDLLKQLSKRRLTTDRLWSVAGWWDVGVRDRENVLHSVLKRHLQVQAKTYVSPLKKIRGKDIKVTVKDPSKYVEEFLGGLLDEVREGKTDQIQVRGWNIGYDWGRLEEAAYLGGEGTRDLLSQVKSYSKGGRLPPKIKWVDVHSRWRQVLFETMRKSKSYTPTFLDYSMVDSYVSKGILKPKGKELEKLLAPHDALRSLMDELNQAAGKLKAGDPSGASDVWRGRFLGKRTRASGKQIDQVVQILTKASDSPTYTSFHQAQLELRKLDKNDPWVRNLFDIAYEKELGRHQGHVSLLGKSIRDQGSAADIGLVDDAFSFVRGGKQSEVGNVLMAAAKERWDNKLPKTFLDLEDLLSGQVHDSDVDKLISASIDEAFDYIEPTAKGLYDEKLRSLVVKRAAGTEHIEAGVHSVLREAAQKRGPKGYAQAVLEAGRPAIDIFKRIPQLFNVKPGVFWGITGLTASAAILLSDKEEKPVFTEGIREPDGAWSQIAGIEPSGDTKTDFGSGRNPIMQMLGYPHGPQVEWIGAGQLGLRGDNLYESIVDDTDQDSEIMRKGTWIGQLVAITLQDSIAGSEEYVALPDLGIHGQIDILLASGIPLEVKTVGSVDVLKSLRGPKSSAISQANFYALATQAPFSYVAYFSRDDPSKFRLFKVNADYPRLLSDRAEVIQAQDIATSSGQKRWEPFQSSRFMSLNNPGIGLERMWDTFYSQAVPPVRIYNPMAVPEGTYPRATNAYDAIPKLRDYAHLKRETFRSKGHGGVVQHLHREAKGAKIREQRTRLSRVQPSMYSTRAPNPKNRASRCEVR